MPGPLAPVAIFAGPGAVAAAKHLAVRAATSPGVTSATLTSVLFYWAFQKLPDWVKEDISFKNLLKNREDLSKEQFVGLLSVVDKLQNIASNIKELDTDIPQLHAALLAFIQLSGQNKLQQLDLHRPVGNTRGETTVKEDREDISACSSSTTSTDANRSSSRISTTITRDSIYESAGNALDLSTLRSSEIQNALKMATFAYYEDSKVCPFRWYITRVLRVCVCVHAFSFSQHAGTNGAI